MTREFGVWRGNRDSFWMDFWLQKKGTRGGALTDVHHHALLDAGVLQHLAEGGALGLGNHWDFVSSRVNACGGPLRSMRGTEGTRVGCCAITKRTSPPPAMNTFLGSG